MRRGEWWRIWLKYSETNTYQRRQLPHPTLASLISHFLLMWLMPTPVNVCGALYMTHVFRTGLYNYLNMGHSQPLNPWICVIFFRFPQPFGGNVDIQRQYFSSQVLGLSGKDGCVSSSSHACDLCGAPATRQLPPKCLKMAVCFQSMSREQRCFFNAAKTGAWWRSQVYTLCAFTCYGRKMISK